MKRLFIFDVDGVLLDLWPAMRSVFACYYNMSLSDKDWDDIIDDFLHNPQPYLEFGEYFSQSQTFKNLLPIKGMPELVFNLSNHCFDLAIVSSADPAYIEQRRQNIKEHYADCFEKIICVGMKQTKEEALRQVASGYDEVFFVDDNPRHLFESIGIVTCPIWLENKHHLFLWQGIDNTCIKKARNAKDILDIALKHA